MVDIQAQQMTVAEFKTLPETTQPTELIDGALIVSPSPRHTHQKLVLKMARYIEDNMLGGEVGIAPDDVYLDAVNAVQPDVFWVGEANPTCALGDDDYWYGAPDLIAEVLSPSTEAVDRGQKYQLYERQGVREYWLVQPQTPFVEVFTLVDGAFVKAGLYQLSETFASTVLGGAVPVKALLGL